MRGRSPHCWFVVCLCVALTSCGAMSAPPVSLPAPISGRLSGPIEVVPESTPNTVTIHAPAGTTLAHATILIINVTVEQSISADGHISGDGLCAGLVRFCITADANGGFSFTFIASPGDRIVLVVVDRATGQELSERHTITILIDAEGNSFVELEEGETLQGITLATIDATADEVTVAGEAGTVEANATLLLVNEDRAALAARPLPRFLALVWRQVLPFAYAAEFPGICYRAGHLCVTADATGAFTASLPGAAGERISIHLLDTATEEKGARLSGLVVKRRGDTSGEPRGDRHGAGNGHDTKEREEPPVESTAGASDIGKPKTGNDTDAEAPKVKKPADDRTAHGQAHRDRKQEKEEAAVPASADADEKNMPAKKGEEKIERREQEQASPPSNEPSSAPSPAPTPTPAPPRPKGGGKK